MLPLAAVLSGRGARLTLALLAAAYGGAIELIQPRFGRDAAWADFVADVAGVAAGAARGRWLGLRLGLRSRRRDRG